MQAICDFVHNHVTFGYEHSRATRTAFEAYSERRGVCRDFAHLAIAFCRCLNIPARYCTGYITDIGLPPPVHTPMGFLGLDGGLFVWPLARLRSAQRRRRGSGAFSSRAGPATPPTCCSLLHIFGPGTLSGFRVVAEAAAM